MYSTSWSIFISLIFFYFECIQFLKASENSEHLAYCHWKINISIFAKMEDLASVDLYELLGIVISASTQDVSIFTSFKNYLIFYDG